MNRVATVARHMTGSSLRKSEQIFGCFGDSPHADIAGLSSIQVSLNFGGSTHNRAKEDVAEDIVAEQVVTMYDGRSDPGRFRLDEHAFELVSAPTLGWRGDGSRLDLYDAEVVAKEVFPQVEALILERLPGAKRALAFDHIVRNEERLSKELAQAEAAANGNPPHESNRAPSQKHEPKTRFLQGTLPFAHGDYTARSGFTRAEQLLRPFADKEVIESAIGQRFAIVNVWYPFETVKSDPLGMCTWRSASPGDVVTNRMTFKSRVGETYKASYSPRQHWVYFSEVTSAEAIILKTFDSLDDGSMSRFGLHTSFKLPEQREREAAGKTPSPARESMEVRLLVLFGDGLEDIAKDFTAPHMPLGSALATEITAGFVSRETLVFDNEW